MIQNGFILLTTCSQTETGTHGVRFAFADEDFGDAKVADLHDHLVLVQQNILRLEVPVQDELVVHVVEGQQDLHKEVKDGVLVQQRVAALLDVVSQGAACVSTFILGEEC